MSQIPPVRAGILAALAPRRVGRDDGAGPVPCPVSCPARCPVLRPLVLAVAALLGTSGCASVTGPALERIRHFEIPDNDASFRTRVYAGAALGNSRLDPNTAGTVFNVEDPSALGTQLKLGVDVHNMLALELETGVLGQAKLREAGTEVSYTAASVSALVYGFGGVQMRSRREGWSAFGRLGYGSLSKSSRVVPFDEDVAGAVLGIGGEYGFDNGLGIRGELTRYAADAVFAGMGAVWRFGTPREVGGVFAGAARSALGPVRETYVAADGRGLVNSGRDGSRSRGTEPRLAAALPGHPYPTIDRDAARRTAPEVAGGARRVSGGDVDGDGVGDARDGCAGTAIGTSVDARGCGLFDAVLGDVTFKSGSWWLSPRSRAALDDVGRRLVAFPEVRIEVVAHTDAEGPADLNLALSARRAEVVVDYLRGRGLSELQLESTGAGETRPLASNDSPAGRRRNRRIELVTLTDLPSDVLAGRDVEGSVWHYPSSALAKRVLETLERDAERPRPAAAAVSPDPAAPRLGAARAMPDVAPGEALDGVIRGVDFAPGSVLIGDAAGDALGEIRDELRRRPSVRVAIMVHTEASGDPIANRTLSRERAEAVVERLVSLGIAPDRLEAEGHGDTLPRTRGGGTSDPASDRRVEIRVLR